MYKFFILGLPRSRTTWLSAFLQGPEVFCVHDFFSTSVDTSIFYEVPHTYAGSVDTNPVVATEYKKYLECPLIIIRRDPAECLESLCKLFGEGKRDYLGKCITKMNKALKEAEVYADMIIEFNDIDEHLEDIWELCLPTIPVDPCKVEMFKHITINSKGLLYKDLKEEYGLWH